MNLGETGYIEQRLDDQIEWYDKKSGASQKAFKRLRLTEIVIAAAIPLLAGFGQESQAVTYTMGLFGMIVAVIAGVVSLYRFQENWTEYRATAEALKQEKFLYMTRAEPYNAGQAFELLVHRVEALLRTERTGWTQAMRAASAAKEQEPG